MINYLVVEHDAKHSGSGQGICGVQRSINGFPFLSF